MPHRPAQPARGRLPDLTPPTGANGPPTWSVLQDPSRFRTLPPVLRLTKRYPASSVATSFPLGARAAGAAGVATADDEVQTLSGSVSRAPSGPPSTPSTPGCAAAVKGPGAQQPKPASLGRGRGAAAAILSLGNVLNYLDRYTVAGERVPHPVRVPGPSAWRYPGAGPLYPSLSWGP